MPTPGSNSVPAPAGGPIGSVSLSPSSINSNNNNHNNSRLNVGSSVLVQNLHTGIIRFIGRTKFAAGDWIGVELDKPVGKHDGIVEGYRYFQCKRKNHGIFVSPKDVKLYQTEDNNTNTNDNDSNNNQQQALDSEIQSITERLAAQQALAEARNNNINTVSNGTSNNNNNVQEEEYIESDGTKVRKITKTSKTTYTTTLKTPIKNNDKNNTNVSVTKSTYVNRVPAIPQNTSNNNIIHEPELIKNLDTMLARRSSIHELKKTGIIPNENDTTNTGNANILSPQTKSFGSTEPTKRRLWLWGENQHGELCTGDELDVRSPLEITDLFRRSGSELAQFSLGLHHTVALSMTNDVYTAGSWISGLLGHDDRNNIHRLKRLKQFVLLKKQNPQNPIIHVSCSDRHSVALHASGELYTWGGTLFGKLGHLGADSSSNNGSYFLVKDLQGKRVLNVSCGNWHTAACTDEGEVYTFGGGGKFFNSGQLGTSDKQDSMYPKKISKFGSHIYIRDIECGGYHTLALSASRQVYSWGRGGFGQLGLGTDTDESEPRLIESLAKIGRCLTMAAGENHSLCAMESGELYSFGYAMQGQLGHGPTIQGTTGNERLPKRIEFFSKQNISIVQVSAGWRHSIALTIKQEVYTWGHGDRGQLGHGDTKSYSLPKLVEALINEDIRQVGAGGSHSLAFNAYFKAAQDMLYIGKVRQAENQAKKQAKIQEELNKSKREQQAIDRENEIKQGHLLWDSIPAEDNNDTNDNTNLFEEEELDDEDIIEEPKIEEQQEPQEEPQQEAAPQEEDEPHQQEPEPEPEPIANNNMEPVNIVAPSGLSLEIVYTSQVQMIHRFITFQTLLSPRQFQSIIDNYISIQYNNDKGTVFDNFIISRGNITPRYNLINGHDNDVKSNNHTDESDMLNNHIHEYNQGPARYTLQFITNNVEAIVDENLWPEWASSFYYSIIQLCNDIDITNNAKQPKDNNDVIRYPIAFRELRPERLKYNFQQNRKGIIENSAHSNLNYNSTNNNTTTSNNINNFNSEY